MNLEIKEEYKNGLTYLTTPYSHDDFNVKLQRFNAAAVVAGYLMNKGLLIFSPITHTHPIAVNCRLPGDFTFWENLDREFIVACSRMIVVKMDGWGKSKGVKAEIEFAKELGMDIIYMDYPI